MTSVGIAILITVVIAGIILCNFVRKPSGLNNFAKRLVNDKAYSNRLLAALNRRAQLMTEAAESPPLADFEIPGLVRDLLGSDAVLHDAAFHRLQTAEKRSIPALLSVLDDPRCTWKKDEPGDFGSSPALRVCRILVNAPCRSLGDKIGHLAESPDHQVSSVAVEAKAALGRSSEIAFVLECLNSENATRQRNAQEGIEKAIKEGWAEAEFVSAVLEWARQSIFDPKSRHSDWGVRFFAAQGSPEAIRALQSPEILNLENNRTIHFVLNELASRNVQIPRPLLESFLEKTLTERSWPWPWVFDGSLKMLAAVDLAAATQIAAENFDHDNETIARHSIDFFRVSNGLPRPWEIEPPESIPISHDEREVIDHLETCSTALGQIGNGGLSQYFFNSTGDQWPHAAHAFRAIGYPEGVEILERAARMVAEDGASLDRDTRIQQIAKLTPAQFSELDSLSSYFWGIKMDRIMLQFMVRHKALFQRISSARNAVKSHTQ